MGLINLIDRFKKRHGLRGNTINFAKFHLGANHEEVNWDLQALINVFDSNKKFFIPLIGEIINDEKQAGYLFEDFIKNIRLLRNFDTHKRQIGTREAYKASELHKMVIKSEYFIVGTLEGLEDEVEKQYQALNQYE